MPMTIEGTPDEHLGGEAHRCAERAVAALGQEHAGADAERQADEAGQAHHVERADDGVADAAAGLADRRGQRW